MRKKKPPATLHRAKRLRKRLPATVHTVPPPEPVQSAASQTTPETPTGNHPQSALHAFESTLQKETHDHPLTRITTEDIVKGFIGAFIGLVIYYVATAGTIIPAQLSLIRATLLYPFALFVGALFMYAAGFHHIRDPKLIVFIPARLAIVFITALIVSVLFLAVWYPGFGADFLDSYKMIASVILAALIGGCTADLFGKGRS